MAGAAEITKLQKIEGLEQHEVVALAALGENIQSIDDAAAVHEIRNDMEPAGFTRFATTIALKSLVGHGLVQERTMTDDEGYKYSAFKLTDGGWNWILNNKREFLLRKNKQKEPFDDSDIPF